MLQQFDYSTWTTHDRLQELMACVSPALPSSKTFSDGHKDCGGIPGFYSFVDALFGPNHEGTKKYANGSVPI